MTIAPFAFFDMFQELCVVCYTPGAAVGELALAFTLCNITIIKLHCDLRECVIVVPVDGKPGLWGGCVSLKRRRGRLCQVTAGKQQGGIDPPASSAPPFPGLHMSLADVTA